MSTFLKRIVYTLFGMVFFILINTNSFGQFEQKITVNASGAIIYPDMLEEFSSFGLGYGIDGGIMYNLNRRFSLFGNARFYYMFGSASYDDAYLDNMAFGGGIKLNLLPSKRLNPYLFAEANINFIWFEEYIYDSENTNGGYYDSDFGTSIGGLGGLGFDFKLNENLSLFAQSGAYYTNWDGRLNLYSQLGVRLNMLKSKTI